MYTIEDLEHGISRLKTLRNFLASDECTKYNHGFWFTRCGSPSCALGWATTLWPKELHQRLGAVQHVVTGHFDGKAAMVCFRVSRIIAYYLFQSGSNAIVSRSVMESDVYETLRRFDIVERYLRRRLATLLAEEEQRQVRRQRRRQRHTVSA